MTISSLQNLAQEWLALVRPTWSPQELRYAAARAYQLMSDKAGSDGMLSDSQARAVLQELDTQVAFRLRRKNLKKTMKFRTASGRKLSGDKLSNKVKVRIGEDTFDLKKDSTISAYGKKRPTSTKDSKELTSGVAVPGFSLVPQAAKPVVWPRKKVDESEIIIIEVKQPSAAEKPRPAKAPRMRSSV